MENQLINDYINLFDQIFLYYKNKIKNQKIAVLASGGIDSSIVAFFCKKYFPQTALYSLSTPKSLDEKYVQIIAQFLNLPLKEIVVKENDIKNSIDIVSSILTKNQLKIDRVQLPLAIAFYLVLKTIKNDGIKIVFTGQGPDILLAGYHMYQNISLKNLNLKIKNDLPLLEVDKKRDTAVANFFNLRLINPYLEKKFIDFALKVPPKLKINFINNEKYEKYLSRKVGERLRLPKEIILRHKKALQYSTGVVKYLKNNI